DYYCSTWDSSLRVLF
nr:immunoglobulin light chain junction region [Macaca mulatta]MOX78778.1 immunoglobulin light chain junction region [Macaca mulatta]MOX79560.1 immunoglobulin light chain junction region [Macaca mulatta]MOX79714.1 immunoglobulin light chain junction region [Macaca mulatta]MOX79954.1 immunoglobulin light chain junction region [Macaca mulatta]